MKNRALSNVGQFMTRAVILVLVLLGGLATRPQAAIGAPAPDQVIAHAMTFLGTPYVWGGNGTPGFDCSGYVRRVWADFGYLLPRVSRSQAMVQGAPKVGRVEDLRPSDLMFFWGPNKNTGRPWINHVGMYIGDGQFIHASRSKGRVVISDIGRWAKKHFEQGRRIAEMPPNPGGADRLLVRLNVRRRVASAPSRPPSHVAAPPDLESPRAGRPAKPKKPTRPTKASKPVVVAGRVVRDPTLADHLKDVDTTDPDQFEHAGEPLPPSMARYFDPFGGEVVAPGPRHLVRVGHAAGVSIGSVHEAGRQILWLSPELSLQFRAVDLDVDLGFPIALLERTHGDDDLRPDLSPSDGDWRDHTRVLRALTYGEKEAPVFVSASRYASATLGWGMLISHVSPSVVARDLVGAELGHMPLSGQLDVNLHAARLETFVDDVLDPTAVAARLQLMPFILARDRDASPLLRELGAGVEVASLFGRGRPGAHMASVDVSLRPWMTGVHDSHLFLAAAFPLRKQRSGGETTSRTLTLGTRHRFRFGAERRHALRLRLDAFAGRGRYRWLDNAAYLPNPAPREPDTFGATAELSYKLASRFEIGGLAAPDVHRRGEAGHPGSDRYEAYAALRNLAIARRVIGSAQAVYQGLVGVGEGGDSLHYVLADLDVRFARYFVAGLVARRAMAGSSAAMGWRRWAFSARAGIEWSW